MNFFILSATSLLQTLKEWDTWLFLKINVAWTNPFLDNVLPAWRNANSWIPFYLFIFTFIILNYGLKSWTFILAIIVTVTFTDQMSSHFFKNFFNRPRPCQNAFLLHYGRLLLSHCSGGQSFTSSHATNHFGVAVFLFATLKNIWGKCSYLLFVWAATISYAQIYVGVHYPLDVLCGAITGILIGYFMSRVYLSLKAKHHFVV